MGDNCMIVRKYYNHIFYEDVEVGDIKLVNKKDFENFKNAVNEIKNNGDNKVFIVDSFANIPINSKEAN